MTSPRSTYGGGYYAAPAFPDTPIYDMLVAERGTPQIAPIRVPSAYETGNHHLPALPPALPALPSGSGHQAPQQGYSAAPQPAPLQQAPAPYIPQQSQAPRGYPGQGGAPQYQQYQQPRQQPQMRPVAAPRPAAPQQMPPQQMQRPYEDPYGRQYPGRGY